MAMVYLFNPYAWGCALAWLVVLGSSYFYICRATALSQFIENRCPDLWPNLAWWAKYMPLRPGRNAGLIDGLVLYNDGAEHHPDDPEFRRLLSGLRWSAGIFLFSFVAAVVLLAQAAKGIHPGT